MDLVAYSTLLISTIKCLLHLLHPPDSPYYVASLHIIMSSTSHKFSPTLTPRELEEGSRLGLDSHADVSCVGKHARILERFSGRSCSVRPFNDSYKSMDNIQTVNTAFAHDTADGRTYILEQFLLFFFIPKHSRPPKIKMSPGRGHNLVIIVIIDL